MRASHWLLLLLVLVTGVICLPPRLWSFLGGGEELVMVVWGQPFEDRLFQDVYATRFAELHPDVRISYQRYSDVMMKYEAWHAVGRGAEVMRIPITDYFSSVEKGMLADLTTFIDDPDIGLTAEQRADFFPWIWETLDLDGQFYALPSDTAQYGLFYNRTLFDEYNADHPDAPLSYPSVAWTWDDLRHAADALTTRDAAGNVTQYGILFDLWAWPFLTFYKQAGGEVWNAAQTTTFVDSSAGVAAMELIAELLPADAPIRTLDQPDTPSGPDDQFKIGKAAMLLDGSWRVPSVEIEAPELDFAVAPLPQGAAPGVVSGSVLWAVSAHAEDKRLAWQMVKWLIEREQALQYWDKLRVAPPARLSLVRSAGFRETRGIVDRETGRVIVPPMPRERYPARAAWLEYAITPHPQTGEMPGFLVLGPYQMDLELALSREMAEVVRGDQSAAEALAEVVRTVHATIDRDRAAKGLPPIDRAANSD